MKYFVLLAHVTVFLSSVLAGDTLYEVGGRLARENAHITLNKRQTTSLACNRAIDAVPEECRQYLVLNVSDSAACSEACAKPLYIAFQECYDRNVHVFDIGVMFDLICARNAAGERCADVFNNLTFDACASPSFCSAQCAREMKEVGFESNCCLYTFNVIFHSSKTLIDRLFAACGLDHAGSCTGAFSGEPIVPAGPPTVSTRPVTVSAETPTLSVGLSAGLSTVAVSYLILLASLLIVMTL